MRYLAPVLAFLCAAAIAAPAAAQPARARAGVQSGEVRSLGDIVNGIRRDRPGSLADVQGPAIGPLGEPHYRIKWVTPDGRVLWLDTDARTGRVLGVEGLDRLPRDIPRRNFVQPRMMERGFGRGPERGPERGYPGAGPRRFFGGRNRGNH